MGDLHTLFDLTGKTAVVTGAGSGLGRAMAQVAAEAGASVACMDINPDTARETSDQVRNSGRDSIYVGCDVGKEDEVAANLDRGYRIGEDERRGQDRK